MAPDSFYAIATAIRDNYPGLYPFLKVDPEVTRAIFKVFQEGEPGAQRLQQAIWETKWYQNNSQTSRERQILQVEDPAEFARTVRNRAQMLALEQSRLGLSNWKNDDKSAYVRALLAEKGFREGWTDEQLRWHLFSKLSVGDFATPGDIYSYQRPGGEFGEAIARVEARAADYGLRFTEKQLFGTAQRQFAGGWSEEGVEDALRKYARGAFQAKAVHDALDQGMTVREFADPYIAQAAQELDLNPAQIDIRDTKWVEALKFQDQEGERVMTLAEWQKHYRNDQRYGFDQSSTAREESANFQTRILEQFGAR